MGRSIGVKNDVFVGVHCNFPLQKPGSFIAANCAGESRKNLAICNQYDLKVLLLRLFSLFYFRLFHTHPHTHRLLPMPKTPVTEMSISIVRKSNAYDGKQIQLNNILCAIPFFLRVECCHRRYSSEFLWSKIEHFLFAVLIATIWRIFCRHCSSGSSTFW